VKEICLPVICVVLVLTGMAYAKNEYPTCLETPTDPHILETDNPSLAGASDVASILARIAGPDTLYYEYERFIGQDSTVGKLWRKDGRIRDESIMWGVTTVILNDTNTKRGYEYYPADNVAYDMDFSPEYTFYLYDLHGYYASIDMEKVRIVGTETYDGLACTVLSIADENGNEREKLWVSEKYGFPVKTETKETEGFLEGLTWVMECKNIKTEDISDSVFEFPQGVQIEQPISMEYGEGASD
jgi:hypothetical protein